MNVVVVVEKLNEPCSASTDRPTASLIDLISFHLMLILVFCFFPFLFVAWQLHHRRAAVRYTSLPSKDMTMYTIFLLRLMVKLNQLPSFCLSVRCMIINGHRPIRLLNRC
jgi:hypothetical protein